MVDLPKAVNSSAKAVKAAEDLLQEISKDIVTTSARHISKIDALHDMHVTRSRALQKVLTRSGVVDANFEPEPEAGEKLSDSIHEA